MPSPESISHIRRDLLDRPVRDYADKLKAELLGILRQYDIKTIDELKRLAQEKKIPEAVVRHYRDLVARLADVVRSGKLPESERDFIVEHEGHTLDLREVLNSSKAFYTSHNLHSLAGALPDTPDSLTPEQRQKIEFALKQGFTSALIIPPLELLQEKIKDIISECMNKPYDNSDDFDKKTRNAATGTRSFSGAYLLLYDPGPVPRITKGRSGKELTALFKQMSWNGLTIAEYLLLQRKEFLARGSHEFDNDTSDRATNNLTLLLDSRDADDKIAFGGWKPWTLMVYWKTTHDFDSHVGARPTVVVPLGE